MNVDSFFGFLTLIFIGLKLGNIITWSWWWVLSPIWAPFVLFLSVFLLCIAIMGRESALEIMLNERDKS